MNIAVCKFSPLELALLSALFSLSTSSPRLVSVACSSLAKVVTAFLSGCVICSYVSRRVQRLRTFSNWKILISVQRNRACVLWYLETMPVGNSFRGAGGLLDGEWGRLFFSWMLMNRLSSPTISVNDLGVILWELGDTISWKYSVPGPDAFLGGRRMW